MKPILCVAFAAAFATAILANDDPPKAVPASDKKPSLKPAVPAPTVDSPAKPAVPAPTVDSPAKPAVPAPLVDSPAKPAVPAPSVDPHAKPNGTGLNEILREGRLPVSGGIDGPFSGKLTLLGDDGKKHEVTYRNSQIVARTEWHENGAVRVEFEYSHGVEIKRTGWRGDKKWFEIEFTVDEAPAGHGKPATPSVPPLVPGKHGTTDGQGGSAKHVTPDAHGAKDAQAPETNPAEEPAVPESSLGKGLVGYYPFNGNTKDHSGNGADAVPHGVKPVADRHGKENAAYNFDGKSWVEIPKSIQALDKLTFCAWFKTHGNSGTAAIVSKPSGDTTTGIRLGLGGSNVEIGIMALSNFTNVVARSTPPTDDRWHHVVGGIALGEMKVFLDGKLAASGKVRDGHQTSDEPVLIGKEFRLASLGGYRFFNGDIDDVRIYDRALSEDEVKALYALENSSDPSAAKKTGSSENTPKVEPKIETTRTHEWPAFIPGNPDFPPAKTTPATGTEASAQPKPKATMPSETQPTVPANPTNTAKIAPVPEIPSPTTQVSPPTRPLLPKMETRPTEPATKAKAPTPVPVVTPTIQPVPKSVGPAAELRADHLVYIRGSALPYTGKTTLLDENGKKTYEGGFLRGRREGPGVEWYATGEKKSEGEFRAGSFYEGNLYWYFIGTAQKKMQVQYNAGKVVKAHIWNRNGSLRW